MAPQRRSNKHSSRNGSKSDTSQGSRSSSLSTSKTTISPLQQSLLSIFSQSFPHILLSGPNNLQERIQRLKQRLYARDFVAAFSEEADLETYALRWSPPRALAYHDLLCSGALKDHISELLLGQTTVRWGRKLSDDVEKVTERLEEVTIEERDEIKIVAFGAGPGAELVAIAGALVSLKDRANEGEDEYEDEEVQESLERTVPPIRLQIVDFGPWQQVLSALESTLSTSASASTTSTAPDQATSPLRLLTPGRLCVDFTQRNVLDLSVEELATVIGSSRLITFLFTLNELYESSKGKTTTLLFRITDILRPNALLLVVDSPGSYATVDVGTQKTPSSAKEASDGRPDQSKAYPMHWLLDHTLLEAASERIGPEKKQRWRKVHEDRSRWFRLPTDTKYPLQLEDIRYQMHCYQRV